MNRPRHYKIPFLSGQGFVIHFGNEDKVLVINGTLTVEVGKERRRVKVSLPMALVETEGLLEGRAAITADELRALLPDEPREPQEPKVDQPVPERPTEPQPPPRRRLVKATKRKEKPVTEEEPEKQVESRAARARRERREQRRQ